ncbi:hypothetical protein QJQ45_014723, partial [Haematococcus lacustris]
QCKRWPGSGTAPTHWLLPGGAEASEAPTTPAGNGTPAVRVQLRTPSESAAPKGDRSVPARSVPGTPQTPPPVSADLDRRAHAFISLTLDRSRYRLLCEAHRTARGLWDALARMHTQELLATRGPVLEQITHLRMTPEQSVTDYWLHAEQLHATANQSGSFRDTMHFALRGLPPDYDVITNPLLTQRPEDVTFAAVLPSCRCKSRSCKAVAPLMWLSAPTAGRPGVADPATAAGAVAGAGALAPAAVLWICPRGFATTAVSQATTRLTALGRSAPAAATRRPHAAMVLIEQALPQHAAAAPAAPLSTVCIWQAAPALLPSRQPIPVLDSPGSLCMAARMAQSPLLWHYRFAHSSCRRLANMVRHSMVLGIDVSAAEFERHDSGSTLCKPCIMGKQHRWVEPQHAGLSRPAQQVLELVHSDVCGPMEVAALDGSLYYDSKLLAVTLIKQKSDAAAAIIDMVTALERQTGSKLKALRSDRGGEYTGGEVKSDVAHLRVWGAPAYIHEPDQLRRKLDSNAAKGIFVGYEVGCKSFRVLVEGRINKSVVVDEAAVLPRTAPAAAVDDEPEALAEVAAPTPVGAASGGTGAGASGGLSGPATAGGGAPPAAPVAASGDAAPADAAAARTASKAAVPVAPAERFEPAAAPAAEKLYNLRPGPTKPNKSVSFSDTVSLCFLGSDNSSGSSSNNDPQSYEEAMARPDATDWLRAMNKEMACQQANHTWQLVKQQCWMRVLPGRWVFKTKRGADGSILKHKARFVIKGYRQVEGVDFDDSFAPVVTQCTQRVLLSVAAARGWELQQLDVKTAFLNAPVDEGRLVYCQQPPGFETGQGLVCQLDKALYGLRQAPRACLSSRPLPIQPAQQQAACGAHHVVYVDDIILASPSSTAIAAVKQQLQQVFSLHDLGPAANFLGMCITRDLEAGTLKLDQQQYIEQVLDRFSMTAANGRVLPMTPGTRLVKEGSPLDSSSAHHYRELVGALLYASTCTRPDIAFAVGQLSRFMQAPTQQHQQVASGLLRYLKRTAEMGLVYSRSSNPQLQGYVDADYAGDPDSMRSTTGSVFVLNVTWRSKLQTTVATSTTEAEYQAAAAGTKEALFLRELLHELDAGCDPIPILSMAASPVISGNLPTILDDDNWPIWSIRTEGLLIEAGLWSVVADGVTPLPTAPAANATQQEQAAYAAELTRSRAESALDRKAKAFIQRHVSNLHIFTVKSADSAQDAWQTLESQFTQASVARQSQLQQQLSLLRMEPGESVARFYARLQQLLTELEACSCDVSESTIVLAILAALPPEYEGIVERLRYDQTSGDLSVSRIKRVLLQKEADLLTKQMQQLSPSSSSLWAYSSPENRGASSSGWQTSRSRSKHSQPAREQQQTRVQSPDRSTRDASSHAHMTCHYCAKPGHIMSECFTFDRDQRNCMRTLFSNPAKSSSPGRKPSPVRSSSPARPASPSRGRTQTPGRAAAHIPSREPTLYTASACSDDDDGDTQMLQPRQNFNNVDYQQLCRLKTTDICTDCLVEKAADQLRRNGCTELRHALYVPDSKQNCISVAAATDDGSSFLFRDETCLIRCNQFGSMLRVNAYKIRNAYILAAVPMPDGPDTDSEPEQLYSIQQSALQPDNRVRLEPLTTVTAPTACSATSNSPQVWHQRLCHASYAALTRMQSEGMVKGVPITAAQFRAAASEPAVCVGCVKGKQRKNVAFADPPPNAAPVTAPLGLIHMDVCGPMHARARDGSLYVATFLDEHTKLSVCVPISSKAEVPDVVKAVIERLETQSGYRCKAIRTDNGIEYVNSRMTAYCSSKGIVHQHSTPYSPQQNGAAERLNRTIFEKARNILYAADMSPSFWAHAVEFANHVRCLLPVSGQPLTPWEAFYGVKPDLSGLRVFGCRVWLHVPDHQRSKLQAKSVEGLFLGYQPGSKAYRVLVNGRETCSKDIVFDELSVLQSARQQDQPNQPVLLLPLPPSPGSPSETLIPAAPAEGGNSLQQTSSSGSGDSGSSSSSSSSSNSSISRPGSSAQRPRSRPLDEIETQQDSSSEPEQDVSEPDMWEQQQLELINRLPRPGIGRFSLRPMPLARETVGAQPAAPASPPAVVRPAAPVAARPAAPAAASTAARPAAPAAASAAPTAARPAAPAAVSAAPAAARQTAPAAASAAARQAAPAATPPTARPAAPTAALAVHPSAPMPAAPDSRPASPEAPGAPQPRRNPPRDRRPPLRIRQLELYAMTVADSPINDTPTVAEALAGPMADLWIEAMNAELASLHANQTWCLEERPANARVLPTKWVLKVKRDAAGNIEKLKARLVAKGFYQQSGVDVGDVYAPVSKHTTLRTLLAKAAAEDMEIHQLDFETAFLNGQLEPGEVIYVQQPEGFEEGSINTVCRLQKALYGLRQAPRAWHARLSEELLSIGFKASEADPALFTLQLSTGMVYLLVYVDDCLLCTQQGDTAGLAYVKKQLSSAFKLKDLGEARWFLGMQLTRDRAEGTIKLDQHKFIQELVTARSKSAAHSKPLPMAPAVKLVREGDALDTTLHHYSALVGSLLYLTCCTRPDIAFAVGALARHMSAPTKQHWLAACSVLCYLKGTADQGLLFGGVSGLQGYSDADYAGDKDTARSTTGYLFTLNGGAISWSSRLQPTVAMSTAEAEYMAASSAAKEALWLRKLMRDLQLDASCVHLGCDNQAAIQLLHNPMATSRAKHIDVHHHFVRERISRGEVAFHYCHTSSMLADILTKPLAAVQFNMGKQGCGVFS